jgi:uncharacterized repeat protein (TIGR01451 family)
MLKSKIATATFVICLMGLARLATAQNSSDEFRPFNGFFADFLGDDQPKPKPKPAPQPATVYDYNSTGTTQLQRAPIRASQPAPQPDPGLPIGPPPSSVDNYNPPLPAPPSSTRPRNSATGNNYSFQYDDATLPSGPALSPPTSSSLNGSAAISSAVPAAPGGLPLHERLKVFRDSPFGDTAQSTPSAADAPLSAPPAESVTRPVESPTIAQRTPVAAVPSATVLPNDPPAATPLVEIPRSTPVPATRPAEVLSSPPAAAEPQHLTAAAKPAADLAREPSVLIDRKSPLLSAETIGPRKIAVGKEAAYEVLLQNSGDLAAEEVTVTIGLPDWAEIAGASASAGEVHRVQGDSRDPCRWVLGRIEARSKEQLALKIIPKQSKPFELAVRWDFKQAPAQAMIEVQEPKLTMHLDGPREVLFGKREVFKLKLGNTGSGPAENVLLTLQPLNAGDTHPITHRLGTINAGDERSIEVELTARQAGSLTIRVEAASDGGARADLAEHVLVHRAALQIDAEGPTVQYVGTPANYKIHLRNSGDAPAKNVKLTVKLPTGVKFVSGSEGAVQETSVDGGKVRWTIDQLPTGEQRVLEMKCTLALSGANRLEITSAADDDLVASAEAITRVEAMADLRLDVKDPEGPVPVGADASYELHVRNRGTKAAENVEVLVYFSNGVEPTGADGQSHRLGPGQVVFDRIPAIPPAAELVLKIKAKAELAGNHVFRAEVHCKTIGTRLVREEVTHFYQDTPILQQATAAPEKPAPATLGAPEEPRTAQREAPSPLLPLPPSGPMLPQPAIRR